mmetsp:Transcript_56837/g.173062  ORF Transcript_56837/g.173062 Transcript_56837/m.173062 type:complete len:517 (-) Transcript_56837:4750-6300(-)
MPHQPRLLGVLGQHRRHAADHRAPADGQRAVGVLGAGVAQATRGRHDVMQACQTVLGQEVQTLGVDERAARERPQRHNLRVHGLGHGRQEEKEVDQLSLHDLAELGVAATAVKDADQVLQLLRQNRQALLLQLLLDALQQVEEADVFHQDFARVPAAAQRAQDDQHRDAEILAWQVEELRQWPSQAQLAHGLQARVVARERGEQLRDRAERGVARLRAGGRAAPLLRVATQVLLVPSRVAQDPEGNARDDVVAYERHNQVLVHFHSEEQEVEDGVQALTRGHGPKLVGLFVRARADDLRLVLTEPRNQPVAESHPLPPVPAAQPDARLDQACHQVHRRLRQRRRLTLCDEKVHHVPVDVGHAELLDQHVVLEAQVGRAEDQLEEAVATALQLLVAPGQLTALPGGARHARHQLEALPKRRVARAQRQEVGGLKRTQLHVPLLALLKESEQDDHGLPADEVLPPGLWRPSHAMQHLDQRLVGRGGGLQGREAADEHQHAGVRHDLLRLHARVEQIGA